MRLAPLNPIDGGANLSTQARGDESRYLILESWRWMFSRGILHFPYWNNIKERRERKGVQESEGGSALLCMILA